MALSKLLSKNHDKPEGIYQNHINLISLFLLKKKLYMVNYILSFIMSTEKPIKQNKTIATKLTPIEYEEITKLINAGIYLNASDFVREAIKDKLKAIKFIKIRDVDHDTAKKEVLGYYEAYEDPYMSEVAEELELDLELVINITKELIKEGRVKELD